MANATMVLVGSVGWRRLLAEAAGFLGGPAPALKVTGRPVGLVSMLPVGDTAVACVAAALTAAAGLHQQRCGLPSVEVELDAAHVAAAVRSESSLLVNGRSLGSGFAPLSRFWQAADGWVRTHANYPWHERALLRALGTGADVAAVGPAIAGRSAAEVEADITDCGGVAAAVRTAGQWREHPQGPTIARQPLIASVALDGAAPRRRGAGELPASGLRVLDLTRVIAGPVATRYLAALGADVLRIDPPHRPELPVHCYDGLPGKRSAVLDARTPDGLRCLHDLLEGADVVVHGYRPGALAAFGLDTAALAGRHPGLVAVSLSAWGSAGPWGGRRGFDSIVQAACGIAMTESPDGSRPGRLPCQLLDHGTGYLAAAAVLEGVRRQSQTGGTHIFELSLAATAAWLLRQPLAAAPAETAGAPAGRWQATLQSAAGPVTVITPPGTLGRPLHWPVRLTTYGQDQPGWPARSVV
jgi:CoA-transferase family III